MKEIRRLIIGLAEVFGISLTENRLKLYAEILADLPLVDIESAIKSLLTDASVRFFPLPSAIRERAERKVSVEIATQELLANAIRAVGLYGYNDPDGAREYLGPTVWAALPGPSGWQEFCFAGDPDGGVSVTTARAQLRERIAAGLRRAHPEGRVLLPGVREQRPTKLAELLPPKARRGSP